MNSGNPALAQVYTVKEFAQAKKISTRTVWRLIQSGELKVERLSARCVRIKLAPPAVKAA